MLMRSLVLCVHFRFSSQLLVNFLNFCWTVSDYEFNHASFVVVGLAVWPGKKGYIRVSI